MTEAKLALKRKPKVEVEGVSISWTAENLEMVLWKKLVAKSVDISENKSHIKPLFSSMARN